MKPILGASSKPSMILLCGLGLGIYWAWNYTFIASTVDPIMWLTNVVSHLCALVLAVLLSKRLAPFSKHPLFTIAMPGLVALGTLMFHTSWLFPDVLHVSQWASSVVAGFSSAVLLLLWSESYARFTIVRDQELVSYCGVIAGFALYLLTAFLPQVLQIALIACLPIASATCTGVVNAASQADIKATRARTSFPTFKTVLPLRLLLCAFGFAIPMGYFKNSFSGDWTAINTIALLLVVCAVVLDAVFKRRTKTSLLPKILILLLSGGLLVLPFFSSHMVVSGALIIGGSVIFRASLYQICGMVASCTRAAPSTVFALATCMLDMGWVVGIALRTLVHGLPASWFVYATVAIAYLVFAFGLVLLSRRFDYFDIADSGGEFDEREHVPDALRMQGERVALAFSLTQREKEVTVLLMRGLSIAQIADEITLSRNTVKTHVNHAYQKCGVHSKEELAKLFEMNR